MEKIAADRDLYTPLEQMRQKYARRKQTHGNREEEVTHQSPKSIQNAKKSSFPV